MGTWAEIRDGMKTRLATIGGLSAHDVMPPTVADKDFAAVTYGDPLIIPAGHGTATFVSVRVIVRVQRGNLKDAQDALDAYIWRTGTNSIVAAVLAAPTLGSKVDDTQWQSTDAIGTLEDGALQASINFRCRVNA